MGPMVTGGNFDPDDHLASLQVRHVLRSRQTGTRTTTALTYKVVRDSNTAHPVYTTTVNSTFWNRRCLVSPTPACRRAVVQVPLYVTDPLGNQVAGDTVIFTPTTNTVSPYAQTIINDAPSTYWRLGEPSGTMAYDWAGFTDGTVGAGVTRGAPARSIGDADTASDVQRHVDGDRHATRRARRHRTLLGRGLVQDDQPAGGKIVGFGDSPDRHQRQLRPHVYIDKNGRVAFG